ncbi:MAG: CoA transferase, partial [Pseudomonadota bacterium]|nr:CoA transferase [Pseudomonadota bacterium]
LHAILRTQFATNTTAHWIAALEARDLLCAPVRKLSEALADPQTAINGMLVRTDDTNNPLGLVGSPVHLSEDGFALRLAPPELGGDGADILAECGYDRDAIAKLRQDGVLA